jgi:quercetin dioxygenase-like cupin family protein
LDRGERPHRKKILVDGNDIEKRDLLLQIVQFRKGEKLPFHYHLVQSELFFALDRVSFLINGREVFLDKLDALLCEPGDIHGQPSFPEEASILVLKIEYPGDKDTYWVDEIDTFTCERSVYGLYG